MSPLIFVTLVTLAAVAAPGPRLSARNIDASISLDGRLDEPEWRGVPASDTFTQRIPNEGQPPSERTTVRVLYDRDALYVGVDCEQGRSPSLRRLTRRDRTTGDEDKLRRNAGALDSDQVAISISSRGDGTSAFHFVVNAAGVLSDGLYYDDTEFDASWDENWEAVTSHTERGWSAEFRIPLRVLRFEAAASQEWGFNVQRTIALRQEVAEWAFVPRTEAGYVSRLGRLDHLDNLTAPVADIELRPFIVSRLARQDAAFGPLRGPAGIGSFSRARARADGGVEGLGSSVGIDGRWHITRDLTLDGTINPDFGQVEADQVVLNLSTQETRYPEKRPFFLEGLDVFTTPLQLLYTRRVGRVPPRLSLLPGEVAQAGVGASSIPGAVKLVGRLTERLSVGVLSAFTAANEIPVVTADGMTVERSADPTALYTVLRLKQAVGDNGHLGTIFSATNRWANPAAHAHTPMGGEICPGNKTAKQDGSCHRDAYVAAIDGRWRSRSGDYSVGGQTAVNWFAGGQDGALPDGTIIGAGDVGWGTTLTVAKEGGRHWLWEVQPQIFSRRFDINDAGYIARQNLAGISADVTYRVQEPWWITRETATTLEYRHRRNLGGLVLAEFYQANTTALLQNNYTLSTEIGYRGAYFDDREVGDGTALERARLFGWEVVVKGDPRKMVSGKLEAIIQSKSNGWTGSIAGGVLVRPASQIDIEVLPNVGFTRGEPRFIEAESDGSLLFGRLAAVEVGGTLRTTYTFTPRLTLQTYLQLFLARGEYSQLSSVARVPETRPAIHLEQLAATDRVPTERPDFQQAALNASIVLRWEYRLGSTFYLVYTRAQLPDVTLEKTERPRLDIKVLPRAAAADVILAKLSFWFG